MSFHFSENSSVPVWGELLAISLKNKSRKDWKERREYDLMKLNDKLEKKRREVVSNALLLLFSIKKKTLLKKFVTLIFFQYNEKTTFFVQN